MTARIANYIRASYPALFLVSHEEIRMEHLIAAAAEATQRPLYTWSLTTGRQLIGGSDDRDLDYLDVLKPNNLHTMLLSEDGGAILLLRDFHLHLQEGDAMMIRTFKDAVAFCKQNAITLVMIGATVKLPIELSKLVTTIEFDLPDRESLLHTLTQTCEANGIPAPEGEELEALLTAAGGLTTTEAEDAFALSLVETNTITSAIVQREKANTIKRNGILELIDRPASLDEIGGLELLKADLLSKRNRFTRAAAEYGIPTPRGILAVGQPGTGKSLTASATSSIFGTTLLRLEAGRLFGSHVGESEANWRNVFATARAIAPCILWIDEVDGLFSGSSSSGRTDGGTTARVTKAILQDMQFNGEGIFFMFTANDIEGIPDPLIDRCEVWNVELPHLDERKAIWRVHIAKLRGAQTIPHDPDDFDLAALARATEGFSGRQIEQVWLAALTAAFNDSMRPPTTEDALAAAKATVPTSVTMAAQIAARRERLKDARKASQPPAAEKAKPAGRKLVAST